MSLTFAHFESQSLATAASLRIGENLGEGGHVEVIRSALRLSHHIVPLRMTSARSGAIFGGVVVSMLSMLATTGWLAFSVNDGAPLLAPADTLVVVPLLSGLYGALAGALSFASDSRAAAENMRDWLREGKPVLIVDDPQDHEETLIDCGASFVGKIV